jgi:predicted DNA binding protein
MTLRQITLRVKTESRLQDAAKANGVKLSVVDCKPFNKTGISLLLELGGEPQSIRAAIAEIRRTEGVRQAVEGEGEEDSVPLLVVLSRPAICAASNDAAVICLKCPLDAESQPALWKFVVRKTSDFKQVLSKLEKEGVEAKTEDITPLERKPALTDRQREIMAKAVAHGYFEFPRKITLTALSELVGVQPSTLDEILRGAERRIVTNAVGFPFQEE